MAGYYSQSDTVPYHGLNQYYTEAMEDNEQDLLACLGPQINAHEVDPNLINSVGQMDISNDFSCNQAPINKTLMEDEFQKAQYALIVDEPMQEQFIVNVPPEGKLESLNYEYPQEMMCYQGNNGNNGIGFCYQPTNENWQQMEPVEFQFEVPFIAPEKQQDEAQADIQREKNKEYSAQCLKRKKDKRVNGKVECEQLTVQVQQLEQKNQEKEGLLHFTVYTVLPSFLGGNNQIMDPSEVNEWVQYYEDSKMSIEQTVDNNRNNDKTVQELWQELEMAKKKAADAAYNLLNKKEMALEYGVSESTFGSRNTRAKQVKESCEYQFQIAWNRIELEKQQSLSDLLDQTWNYFRYPVTEILRNHPNNLYDYEKPDGQEIQFSKLRHFLFQDAG